MLLLSVSPILEDLSASHVCFHKTIHMDHEVKGLSFPNLTRADLTQFGCSCLMFKVNTLYTSVSLCIQTFNLYINFKVNLNLIIDYYEYYEL